MITSRFGNFFPNALLKFCSSYVTCSEQGLLELDYKIGGLCYDFDIQYQLGLKTKSLMRFFG